MIKAGIIGGGGYTAGELIRLLARHPKARLAFVQSKSQQGKKIWETHPDTRGFVEDSFVAEPQEADVYFLSVGHGAAKEWLENNSLPTDAKIIDLSTDFRMSRPDHDFVYGLPELQREKIKMAQHIANPGCFATCIQLGLLPFAKEGLLPKEVHTSAVTGSTGAGQSLSPTTHFTWRDSNISTYKVLKHQHLNEIGQTLQSLFSPNTEVVFVPYRGNFTRGILATSYFNFEGSYEQAYDLVSDYYQDHPFVVVSEDPINLKWAVNTNFAYLHIEKVEGRLVVSSCIDNLLKGASGQAVQNMNLSFSVDETLGLELKPSAF